MSNENDLQVNPIHEVFPFLNLLSPHVTLSRFFELCDALDPIDRDALIGPTAFELGVEVPDLGDVDVEREMRYQQFKAACSRIEAMDHLILRGVVEEIMYIHYRWSDPELADNGVGAIEEFIAYCKACGDTEEELARGRIMAERWVGMKSDRQVARRRYELFCNGVVKPLFGIP